MDIQPLPRAIFQRQCGGWLSLAPGCMGLDSVSWPGSNPAADRWISGAGGAGFGLQVQAAQATRSQLLAGVRTQWGWRGVMLRGYGEWQQTLRQNGLNPHASFTATASWTPLVAAPWPGRSGGVLGLSMVWPVGGSQDSGTWVWSTTLVHVVATIALACVTSWVFSLGYGG